MATPIFDMEIVKLRRRLGDVYNDDGSLISTANVGSSPEVGEAFKRDELVDIYNGAVRLFLDYITAVIERKRWYEFIPGYIRHQSDIPVTEGKVDVSLIDPPLLAIQDLREYGEKADLSRYLPVDSTEFFSSQALRKSKFYCMISDEINIHPHADKIELIYVKEHQNVSHGDVDLPRLNGGALERILLFAERSARGHKNPDVSELPESQIITQQQRDTAMREE